MNNSIFELSEKELRQMFWAHVSNTQQKACADIYKHEILWAIQDGSKKKVINLLKIMRTHLDDFEQARVFFAFWDQKRVNINCQLVSEDDPNYDRAQKYLQIFEWEFLFLTCGGTIDKTYEEGKKAENYIIGNPVVWEIIRELWLNMQHKVQEILRKDSLYMWEEMSEDRIQVAQAVNENKNVKKIIITHGTDTTPETAMTIEKYIWVQEIEKRKQVIVLVWSSKPYSDRTTDAIWNVDFAVRMAEEYEKQWKYGVFVAMEGEMIPAHRAYKCFDGTFIDTKYADITFENPEIDHRLWQRTWDGTYTVIQK